MRTEIAVEGSRNPPAFPDTDTLSYFSKDFLKSKTSLEEDTHMNEFINSLSPFFSDSKDFVGGATFAHQIIKAVPGISLPEEISKDTVNDFREDIERDYQRRKSQNLDTDWYVKDPKSKSPEIYKRDIDLGEKMLKSHLHYASSDYSDLVEYFRGFENPQFKLGAFTVFTLKNWEAQRIEKNEDAQPTPTPIPLVSNVSKLIKSA
jgi:hypothetical protein